MRSVLVPALACGAALALVACGGGSATVAESSLRASSEAAPTSAETTPTATPTESETSAASAPVGAPFVEVIDAALAPFSDVIGTSASSADLASVLPLFDGDVPLPSGTIVGAGRIVEQWGDALDSAQMIGVDAVLSNADLEAYGAAAPSGWAYNSLSTTDSSSTLVMTRESDGLRVVYMSSRNPEPGVPPAEFSLEADASEIPQPAWLSSLPLPAGGELIAVGEGIGEVEVNYVPAVGGLATATWRFPVDQLESLQEFYAGDALAAAGFSFADPDAIRVGASYFDVTAGEWTGQVIVGELMDGDESFASVQWFLTRS